ncbi:hypothetical protein M5689_024559 [Euphorbia peplus]|nr:hypothetical protein M5689_024559 [Euphorbia peplus]
MASSSNHSKSTNPRPENTDPTTLHRRRRQIMTDWADEEVEISMEAMDLIRPQTRPTVNSIPNHIIPRAQVPEQGL